MTFLRTDASNKDFLKLIEALDAYLKVTDGEEHNFYNQFNGTDHLENILVVYENDLAIGCGAIKHFDEFTLEIKRMYVKPAYRGKGVASKILMELEQWGRELKYSTIILETGTRQVEAVALYHKNKYTTIPNYGPYTDVKNSICFKKIL
ncbi:GNAT family N-acetyltransferase [Cellulophaga sp. HaHa_2_1]|uniref:GNAT family N-acetyltransferase n=1 Tax=Cellulophaga sp. HaHa_2_1 TaxID=2749994 RepID=UPI001C4E6D0F|nr:GNAT family N-acetyltransferase [Cellulophaga sp. HaHa_2_1]QXP53453.1 GNAT family N-acetyltransferase [Cellulophaga sp. HaHa_2_1]